MGENRSIDSRIMNAVECCACPTTHSRFHVSSDKAVVIITIWGSWLVNELIQGYLRHRAGVRPTPAPRWSVVGLATASIAVLRWL